MEGNKRHAISFSPPDISELEINEVVDALRSGWITTGPRTKKLEKEIAKWVLNYDGNGSPRCVCLNSATAALELSLRILGIGDQNGGSKADEVITCAYTYTASASVADHVGAKFVLVDCSTSNDSIEMDYDALEKAITPNTKAIIPVDLGGIPCDYDRIFEIVNKKKELFKPTNDFQKSIGRVAVVSDAAHAFGASYKGELLGQIADFTNFSFHAVKNFTTAEGGAILWKHMEGIDDEAIYNKLQLYSLHGQNKDALAKNKLGAWEYDIVGTWYKCNMTDVLAAIGLAQFERYPKLLARRKELVTRYDDALRKIGVQTLDHYNDKRCGTGHLYITWIPGINRDQANEIINRMADAGIGCNVHYKPLPMHTAYKNFGLDIADYPNAYAKFVNEITLPLYTTLTDDDVTYILDNYVRIVSDYIK